MKKEEAEKYTSFFSRYFSFSVISSWLNVLLLYPKIFFMHAGAHNELLLLLYKIKNSQYNCLLIKIFFLFIRKKRKKIISWNMHCETVLNVVQYFNCLILLFTQNIFVFLFFVSTTNLLILTNKNS